MLFSSGFGNKRVVTHSHVAVVFVAKRLTEDVCDYDASWRCGADSWDAGFAVGSQPQESWHRWKLKGGLPHLRLPPDQLFEGLASFLTERARTFQQDAPQVTEWPSMHFDHALIAGERLRRVGRTTVRLYQEQGAVLRADVSEEGGVKCIYGMRKSLFYKENDAWCQREDVLGGLTEGSLVAMYQAWFLFWFRNQRQLFDAASVLGLEVAPSAGDGQPDSRASASGAAKSWLRCRVGNRLVSRAIYEQVGHRAGAVRSRPVVYR